MQVLIPYNPNICDRVGFCLEYPQHMFWLRKKKIKFLLRTLILFVACGLDLCCLTLCIWENPKANSEDPDEMQHNAAFHQGLHCL